MANNFHEKVDFIWSVADLLRGDYKQSEYQKVILPLTVLRRLDCVTEPTKDDVLQKYDELQEQGVENVSPALERVSGQNVYNTSEYTFEKLCEDPEQIDSNLRYYINSFDEDTQEVLEKFDFGHQIERLEDADLLYKVVRKFREIDLHPDQVPNEEMGYIYEELIRKFSELSNETAGEHFTPREVIRLMVNLIFEEDDDALTQPGIVRTLYDPACGTGGMLSIAENYIRELNKEANLHVYGQELNPESYAVCNSDMLIKGQNPDNIFYGNSFSNDGFPSRTFNYMLSNPPFGVSWKKVKKAVEREHEEQGFAGRFGAGTPRVNDGALLFLQHMVSKMKPPEDGGSRIAIVFNGSPMFTGGPNSGESAIRRWIIENDWLEAIVALPDNLFYNTGIHTYIWVLSNRKPEHRQEKIQLINATEMYEEMNKNLGDKSHRLSDDHIDEITSIFGDFESSEHSKIFDNSEFGYRRIVIDRPLRMSFQATPDRIKSLDEERAFTNRDEETQESIKNALSTLDSEKVWMDRDEFIDEVELCFNMHAVSVRKSVYNAIERALGEQNPDAQIVTNSKNEPEYDGDLRDRERVPLGEDPRKFFKREVKPYVKDAWINEDNKYHDEQDGKLGVVGYEINFNRYFYTYDPPRSLEKIDEDIRALEKEISEMLSEVAE
ncbi:type I restriction-modification system subunit M [Halomontanus rarus]|uniref:type I restriction-modification system subunit M n=1 Tax=Halomontanus rarus TaxID=3034020 RepID=UPI0023E7D189|nr:class I SAM-dependent DNA methyltransferase [Halovivax sp. TS33]